MFGVEDEGEYVTGRLFGSREQLRLVIRALKAVFPNMTASKILDNTFDPGCRCYIGINICKFAGLDDRGRLICLRNEGTVGYCTNPCPYAAGEGEAENDESTG
jgi:hypothetical protein